MNEPRQETDGAGAEARRFRVGLIVVLGLTAVVWGGYQRAQPDHDPRYDVPSFDSAYFVAWSDAILGGPDPGGRFEGAFYRAPLYAYAISLLRGPAGAGLDAIRWLQLLLALAATGALAHVAFRWAGPAAGIATAAILGAYHPWLFFSARLIGESWAIALLAAAVLWIPRRGWTPAAGAALGLAVLARPNLLLIAAAWIAWAWLRGRRREARILLLVVAAAVLPVTAWNWRHAGRLVPVAANGGLTLYHGNGPNALGIYSAVSGMNAAIGVQREEARRTAEHLTGRAMDAVEADRHWGRQALRERLRNPLGTLVLVWNRLLLTLGPEEISLDEAPVLDPNPWSRLTFFPFAVILGLAAAGTAGPHRAGEAGWTWLAVAACAATPLVFYVSSRYRLPFAVLLAVPAGAGLAHLLAGRRRAVVLAVVACAFSLAVPTLAALTMPYALVIREGRADGEAELASDFHARSLAASSASARERWSRRAQEALDQGLELDPRSSKAWFVRGQIARSGGQADAAEQAWLHAWNEGRAVPPRVAAAANLSELWINAGRAAPAERLLRQALALEPLDEVCWHNMIAALIAQGQTANARREIARARSLGVPVDPQLDALAQGTR